jgi:hypothetical protein
LSIATPPDEPLSSGRFHCRYVARIQTKGSKKNIGRWGELGQKRPENFQPNLREKIIKVNPKAKLCEIFLKVKTAVDKNQLCSNW